MAKLHVGDKLPNFEFKNAYDVTKTVEKDVLGKKTVFWVIRYIGCTICRYDVHVLAQLHEQFKAKGVQVFVVMQSDPAIVREELKDANIPFDIVCDPAMAIYKQFEIPCAADKAELGGNEAQMARLQVKGAAAALAPDESALRGIGLVSFEDRGGMVGHSLPHSFSSVLARSTE